jgi:hypothetical protein
MLRTLQTAQRLSMHYCLYVHGRSFTCLNHLGFFDFPISCNGIFSDPSIFAHAGTIILSLLLLPPRQLLSLKAYVLFRIKLKNNPYSCALIYPLGGIHSEVMYAPLSSSIYFLFNYTFGFLAHGSVATLCTFSESI